MKVGTKYLEHSIQYRMHTTKKTKGGTQTGSLTENWKSDFEYIEIRNKSDWEKVKKFCKENEIGNHFDPINEFYKHYKTEREWNEENIIENSSS